MRVSRPFPTLTRRRFLAGLLACPAFMATGEALAAARKLLFKKGFLSPREALFYEQVGDGVIHCQLCPRGCVVEEGGQGFCRTRENRGGRYFALAYANPCAVNVDPIEKKPFFHVLPTTSSFSLATAGCNLRCKFCQNWKISQAQPRETENASLSPQEVVAWAQELACPSITSTYVEPTIFYEYMLEIGMAARGAGILKLCHSNGFINETPLRRLARVLSAACIDLKGFSEAYYRTMSEAELAPVLRTLKVLKEEGVWVEIVNLVVPEANDDPKMLRDLARFVARELSTETPVHFTRFYPQYRLTQLPPTPVSTLEKARTIAKEEGLKFVYIGNVSGHPAENTCCPDCGRTLIRRMGYFILENLIDKGHCPSCKRTIPGIWGSGDAAGDRPGTT